MRSRSTVRVVLSLAAVVVATSCSADESAASGGAPVTSVASGDGTYLALGDSVPFGFRGGATADFADEDAFVGYPELVGEELDLDVVNASCPGETTASFLDTTAQSNGCVNSLQSTLGYRAAYPLHVRYESAEQSQMDFAVDTLTEDEDVELVTVQIGANDAFLCQQTTQSRCTDPADLRILAKTTQANLGQVLSTLREGAGYDGQIVVVTYYALDYSDPFGETTRVLGNGLARVAKAHGAHVVDGYEAFRARATEAGGDSTAAGLVLPDDIHPSDEGQRLLADAVTAVVED